MHSSKLASGPALSLRLDALLEAVKTDPCLDEFYRDETVRILRRMKGYCEIREMRTAARSASISDVESLEVS